MMVKVIEPLLIEGVKVGVNNVLLEKLPLGLADHKTLDVLPEVVAANCTALPAQTL